MNTIEKNELLELVAQLKGAGEILASKNAVTGFDGFVDEIISVVKERQGVERWTRIPDIAEFGDMIKKMAGQSALREIVVHRQDSGGCAVNLGDGLVHLGVPVDCFATLGSPRHPSFEPFARLCRSCHSWGRSYARTLAFEFQDGKIMLSDVSPCVDFDEKTIDGALADGAFAKACERTQLIALTNWTLFPHMTACWRKIQREVFSKCIQKPYFFLDLVDPSIRSEADIRDMLDAVRGLETCGPTTLGLNGNEANILSRILELPSDVSENRSEMEQQAEALREKIKIQRVVIHRLRYAASATASGSCCVEGFYCPQPRKCTGGGDRFNAGFCVGLLLGLSETKCLHMGGATSGVFVRQARSASIPEVGAFMESWAKGTWKDEESKN